MAASRSYHRYFSGENEVPTATNSMFELWNVASSPELHKTVTGSRISKKSTPAMENQNHRYFSGENEVNTAGNLMFEFNEFDVWNALSSPDIHKTVTDSRISKKPTPAETENRREVRRNHRYFSGENEIITTTNLMFEFNEFDVWNLSSSPELHKTVAGNQILKKSAPATENRREVTGTAVSLPVDVPDWSMILKEDLTENRKTVTDDDDDFDEDLYGGDDLIPPHEYLARSRIASFSVHEGFGRTLKGRDLSRVRNAVWKKIGFED